MKILSKIEIHRFRSISDSVIDVDDINIFSGKNNSGKSNVLKALNIFFNGDSGFDEQFDFVRDYNKAFTGQAGGKRETFVELHFVARGKAALSHPFSIRRTFAKGLATQTTYHSTNIDIQSKISSSDGNVTRQFTAFINKVEYFYIPAIRDKKFTQGLFLHFKKLIEQDSEKDDFSYKIDELSNILQRKSKEISSNFEKFINLPTRAALSSNITDLLGAIEINVRTGIIVTKLVKGKKIDEYEEVDLFSSGDGILMSYLAYFLAHVSKKISKKICIWGFEEPRKFS